MFPWSTLKKFWNSGGSNGQEFKKTWRVVLWWLEVYVKINWNFAPVAVPV